MIIKKGLEVLRENGIAVEESTSIKNGKEVESFQLGEGRIRPTVYEAFFESINSESELLTRVNSIIANIPEVDLDSFFNKEFFMDNCMSCVRHQSPDETTVKFPVYGDLEEYIRVRISDEMSLVVTHNHLSELQIDMEELRTAARRHLTQVAKIRPMSEVMSDITGMEADSLGIPSGMWIASTENNQYGAAVILLEEALREFCEDKGIVKLCIIPSSIHEAILTIAKVDTEWIDSTICEVNDSEVSESEQLSSHCYFFEV